MKPIWLLDIDGVINANPYKIPSHIWPEYDWIQKLVYDSNDRAWPFMVAEPVVRFIREVHTSGKAEILWLTTWQNDAQKVAGALNLPEFRVVTNPMYKNTRSSFETNWWKLSEAVAIADEYRRPLVWTDDDLGFEARSNFKQLVKNPIRTRFISPGGNEGLTPNHLYKIEEFLKEGNHIV